MLDKVKKYYKNLSNYRKKTLPLVVISFVVLFFTGISLVYAFYHNSYSFPIFANKVGNFDGGNGDLAIVIYKQSNDVDAETPEYKRVYGVPKVGYTLNNVDCNVPCTESSNDSCYYSYDKISNMFTITSNTKVSCKFYFNKTAESDINVYIAVEDDNGELTYDGKNYREIESIPAYGYEYRGAECQKDATISYDAATKTFNVSSLTKNECYAYFYKTLESDIIVNVFVQTELGSNIYQQVNTIPENKGYIVSPKADYISACYDSNGNITDGIITYSGGYISATAKEKQTCNVYLDLYEGAPFIESVNVTSTDTTLKMDAITQEGVNNIECYKYKINGVTTLSECMTSPSYTFTNLNSCTYYNISMYAIDSEGIQVGYTKTYKTTGC